MPYGATSEELQQELLGVAKHTCATWADNHRRWRRRITNATKALEQVATLYQ